MATGSRLEALEAVAAAARAELANATRYYGVAPLDLEPLRDALATLDALPGKARVLTCPACGESYSHPDDHAKPYPASPLKPGDEVTICHETVDDGYAADILVTVRADEVYLCPRVSACNGTTFGPEMRVDHDAGLSLTHAQAAELCATLARVRVP